MSRQALAELRSRQRVSGVSGCRPEGDTDDECVGHEARQSATTWRDATHDNRLRANWLSGANRRGVAILGDQLAVGIVELDVQQELVVGGRNDGVDLAHADRAVGREVALPLPLELV